MSDDYLILGDWGTTTLRLYLLDHTGEIVDQLGGPGVSKVEGSCENVFFELCQPWLNRYSIKRAVLSGMVGSTLGWQLAEYMTAPVNLLALTDQLLTLQINGLQIDIVPGVTALNPLDYQDVMRGEEVQVLGALSLSPALAIGERWLCLPGTHTKWVQLVEGKINTFFTVPAGELFDLLRHHSTLLAATEITESVGDSFDQGVVLAKSGDLLTQLFQLRSRAVLGELNQQQQQQLLSGLLIGSEVASAQKILSTGGSAVTIIASPRLSAYYQRVTTAFELDVQAIDGDAVSLAGLMALAAQSPQVNKGDAT